MRLPFERAFRIPVLTRSTINERSSSATAPGRTPHDFRRSAAKQIREAGIAETTIMSIAGWSTREMFKRYAITDGSDIRAAVVKLEQARAENSHSFSHNLASEPKTEVEVRKEMIQ